jgi:hypothetical protein
MMMKGQPGPSEMLEELADKVIGHMDRLAVTSFRDALDEMIDFHRFLIDAYLVVDNDGSVDSYSRMGSWKASHVEWLHEYRRLFDRAAKCIGHENEFVETLAYVPSRLLPRNALTHSSETTLTLLDGVIILAHQVENWLSSRDPYQNEERENSDNTTLSGAEQKAYSEVVRGIVGAWESTLCDASSMYGWSENELSDEEKWGRLCKSWPFLQRHLTNTAYVLALSVWNEDEDGAMYYSEMLTCWLDQIEIYLGHDYYPYCTLLVPDIFELSWDEAQRNVLAFSPRPGLFALTSKGLFSAVLKNCLDDVKLLVGGIMQSWFLSKKQSSDIAFRAVEQLLNIPSENTNATRRYAKTNFSQIVKQIIRIQCSGNQFNPKGYGGVLDAAIEKLDRMSERPVVSGRVYEPSTKHRRSDVYPALLSLLLARMSRNEVSLAKREFVEFATEVLPLVKDDTTIRSLRSQFMQFGDMLSDDSFDFIGNADVGLDSLDENKPRLAAFFRDLANTIDSKKVD